MDGDVVAGVVGVAGGRGGRENKSFRMPGPSRDDGKKMLEEWKVGPRHIELSNCKMRWVLSDLLRDPLTG